MDYFDQEKWKELIQKPDWYLKIVPELEELKKNIRPEERENLKEQIYSFFEEHLENYDIALGEERGIWDQDRKPIDTIVIHHTSNIPGMTPIRLSAIELIRLYAPYYKNPTYDEDKNIIGKPISSGHIRAEKQAFYPYHWLIRTDGSVERLLNDDEVGWHAGVWETNLRSIAICLDNDYENSRPQDIEIRAIADLIGSRYSQVLPNRIFGHREINPKTTCPSNLFLSSAKARGWKDDLILMLKC